MLVNRLPKTLNRNGNVLWNLDRTGKNDIEEFLFIDWTAEFLDGNGGLMVHYRMYTSICLRSFGLIALT